MHRFIFKALANSDRIVCVAQIRRSKLRCTCHGAIFERVLVRRTQEYKSIPRTTSRKSPEIAHVRRHGFLPCMPLFSPREPLFHRRCAPLKVSLWRRMSAVATEIFIVLTGENALLLTAFALAFSPVSPLFVAAFAALRVSFPGACPGKDGSLEYDGKTTEFAYAYSVFSP